MVAGTLVTELAGRDWGKACRAENSMSKGTETSLMGRWVIVWTVRWQVWFKEHEVWGQMDLG